MSVSLSELVSAAGYDIKNNTDDMKWFLGLEREFYEMTEEVENKLYELEEI